MKVTIDRLRMWDGRSQAYGAVGRNFLQAFSQLDRLADNRSVNDVLVQKAAYIYRKALKRGVVRGRSVSKIIAACLYAACRDTEMPRTLKDVASASNLEVKEVSLAYRLIVNGMSLTMPVTHPGKCISRIASKAGLTERTRRRGLQLLNRAVETNLSAGKDPMCLAASALYIACVIENEEKTQKDITEAANVTEVPIRNGYKRFKAIVDESKENSEKR